MSENIFADEWIECLEAHYMHVIRINDKVTEPSLSIVMHDAGFSDAQLAELRVRATMHVDQVGADFVPDLNVLEAHEHSHNETKPAEAPIYNIPIDTAPVQTETTEAAPPAVSVEAELEVEPAVASEVEAEPDTGEDDALEAEKAPEEADPDEPQQLSLF